MQAASPHSYARQRFFQAVEALITTKPMRQRLGGAMDSLAILKADDLPDTLQSEYASLMIALDECVQYYTYQPSEVKMRQPKSDRIAAKILDMFVKFQGGL